MSGSSKRPALLPIDDAKTKISQLIPRVSESETVTIEQALDRVLAEDVFSPIDVPGYNNSAMDGYAFKLEGLIELDSLRVVGKSLAGHPYNKPLGKGECVLITTGAMMPEGADTVMMQENAHIQDDIIQFSHLPNIGNDVRLAGESIKQNSLVLTKGKKLNAANIGLLASLGCHEIKVYRKVKVAVFATGDELMRAGETYQAHKIYESNRASIIAILSKLNCEIIDFGIVSDNKEELRRVIHEADKQADCVITSGGVSVGEADLIKDILAELGQIDFWKIAIKPGKPLAFGRLPQSVFFGLPGNPVSAFVTFDQIARDAIKQMGGEITHETQHLPAVSLNALKKRPGRTDYQRGRCFVNEQGELVVESSGAQGSGIFSSFLNSNCYIVLEQERGKVEAGEKVSIQLFDASLM